MNQDDALEAAKLAAMVGSQLRTIDQYATSHGNSPPANKIDINSFVQQARNPNQKLRAARYLTEPPAGFAPPSPEDLVQSQIPDVQPQFIPQPPQQQPLVNASNLPVGAINLAHIIEPIKSTKVEITESKSILTRSDIDSIRNSLKSIDKSLSGLLNFFKNSKSNE
jgi:hypothetical protein